ncbi:MULTISPECIES: IclR family transcriptional regulator [unclassified Streptomyces]|uniref:IclR family transcriptional regulator n=1 Tax=unclassified Streptomyces TaxID=2593676 RepID=UPI002E80D77B|nr:IclR family transcriptional regulator [Streptomyces sp. NBC_00589]WTI34544.1 IclR family transcriptional regulator [Streptomyces sp. NBC_00775]WUB31784.1 IclR family transcriptional regulator [Streptomyces sp. NBC_00589]
MTAESEQAGMRTVQRAIDILGLFDESRPAMSIREIVTASGLPKTTVLRLLGTLRMNGLLWVDEHGRYIAGPALLRWSRLAEQAWRLPPAAGVILRDLAAEHKETVHLYVRRDIHRVCIAQEEGPQTLRQVVRVGDELPLWAGGVAKALLVDAPDALLRKVAEASPHGIAHLDTLHSWIAEAREHGYAVSHGEREEGLSAVAVPVRGRGGAVVAALSFGGPSTRFTAERVGRFAEGLTVAAGELAKAGLPFEG